MRTLTTIVLAAAMIHCSASAEKTATSDGDVIAGRDNGGEAPRQPERLAPPEQDKQPPAATSSDGFTTLPSLVLTSVKGPDGATYVAGTYSGSIVINGSTFMSSGKEDVFIARLDVDKTVAWARSVGSLSSETGPRLSFEDDQLKLLATTRGEVDCGAGPIGTTWNSEMFFMCYFDNTGAALGGVAFPTGAK